MVDGLELFQVDELLEEWNWSVVFVARISGDPESLDGRPNLLVTSVRVSAFNRPIGKASR